MRKMNYSGFSDLVTDEHWVPNHSNVQVENTGLRSPNHWIKRYQELGCRSKGIERPLGDVQYIPNVAKDIWWFWYMLIIFDDICGIFLGCCRNPSRPKSCLASASVISPRRSTSAAKRSAFRVVMSTSLWSLAPEISRGFSHKKSPVQLKGSTKKKQSLLKQSLEDGIVLPWLWATCCSRHKNMAEAVDCFNALVLKVQISGLQRLKRRSHRHRHPVDTP